MTDAVVLDKSGRAIARDDMPVVLPFYLVCDASASMAPHMQGLNTALHHFRNELARNPLLSDKVRFGVIDFSDDARVVVPLCDFAEAHLEVEPLTARGGTSYAAAFRTLKDTIDFDISTGDNRFRYYRPAVFFLTDGYPNLNDPWQQAFWELTAFDPATGQGNKRYPLFVPFGFGDADRQLLASLVHPQHRSSLFMTADGTMADSAIERMTRAMLTSVLQSGRSAATAKPMHVLPTAADVGPGIDVYPGGDLVS